MPKGRSEDQTRKIIFNILGGIVLFLLLSILVAIVAGPQFAPYLKYIGIRVGSPGGVWMDCSKWENRKNRFCGGSEPPTEQEWKGVRSSDTDGKYVPFSLND